MPRFRTHQSTVNARFPSAYIWFFLVQVAGLLSALRGNVHDGSLFLGVLLLLPGSLLGFIFDVQLGSAADVALLAVAITVNTAIFYALRNLLPKAQSVKT